MFRRILLAILTRYYLNELYYRIILRLIYLFVLANFCYFVIKIWFDPSLSIVPQTFLLLLVGDIWCYTQGKLEERRKVRKEEFEDLVRPLSEVASGVSRNRDTIPGESFSIPVEKSFCTECDPEHQIVLPDTMHENENGEVICSACMYQKERCSYCKKKSYRVEMPRLSDGAYSCRGCAEGLRLAIPPPIHQCRECKKDFYREELKFGGFEKMGLVCGECSK